MSHPAHVERLVKTYIYIYIYTSYVVSTFHYITCNYFFNFKGDKIYVWWQWIFPTKSNWSFFTEVWVTASPFKSLGLFYSSWFKQCFGLDGLDSSSHFQFPQPLFQTFGDYSKDTNYNSLHFHFHVPQLFDPYAMYLFIFSLYGPLKYFWFILT